jgi:DNA-binding beta-propeller fold protein YncE
MAAAVAVLGALVMGTGSSGNGAPAAEPAEPAPPVPYAVGAPTTIDLGEGGGIEVAITPDGERVLTTTDEGIVVVDAASSTVLGTIGVEHHQAGLVLAPDGRTAYLGTDEGFEAVDLVSGLVQGLFVMRPAGYGRISAISGDGRRIFGIGRHEAPVLEIADLATGGTRQIPLPARTDSVAVTADGERVFVPGDPDADQPTPVHVLDIATGASRPLPGTERMRYVALSPDGRSLYAIGPAEALEVDVTSGAVVRRVPLGTFGNAFAVSPGGARFYTLGTSEEVQVLDLDEGGLGATVPIAHPYLNELALAPDGSTLYVTSEAGLTVVPIEGGGG